MPKDLLIGKNSSMNTYIMNFFSIDCSTDIGSLFVKIEGKTFKKVLQSDKSNNDLLMKHILDFFTQNNLKLEDISQIFVNQGPGNFSGLRGSLATAKGISLSKKLNLYGYNSFLWSSAKFFKKKIPIFSLITIREKYFVKKFDKNLKKSFEVKEITEKEILKNYADVFKVIPQYATKYCSEKILKLNNLNVVNLDHNELELLQLNGLLNEHLIKPLYLS